VDHVGMAIAQYLSSGFSTGEISPERKIKKRKRKLSDFAGFQSP
jgi:hypothetical protein